MAPAQSLLLPRSRSASLSPSSPALASPPVLRSRRDELLRQSFLNRRYARAGHHKDGTPSPSPSLSPSPQKGAGEGAGALGVPGLGGKGDDALGAPGVGGKGNQEEGGEGFPLKPGAHNQLSPLSPLGSGIPRGAPAVYPCADAVSSAAMGQGQGQGHRSAESSPVAQAGGGVRVYPQHSDGEALADLARFLGSSAGGLTLGGMGGREGGGVGGGALLTNTPVLDPCVPSHSGPHTPQGEASWHPSLPEAFAFPDESPEFNSRFFKKMGRNFLEEEEALEALKSAARAAAPKGGPLHVSSSTPEPTLLEASLETVEIAESKGQEASEDALDFPGTLPGASQADTVGSLGAGVPAASSQAGLELAENTGQEASGTVVDLPRLEAHHQGQEEVALLGAGAGAEASAGPGAEGDALMAARGVPMAYHPDVVEVVRSGEAFCSKLITKRAFLKGSTIAKIEGVTRGVEKRYTSVQCGEASHLELNSDLVFINHSCAPNVAMDIDAMEVWALQDIPEGGELSFFYPTTEWDMDQPFQCWCQADQCVGLVRGAKHLSILQLSRYAISNHIQALATASLETAGTRRAKILQ